MAYAIQGNMINRADKNGPQGGGINENNCFTLNATDQHAVAFFNHSHNANIPSQGKTASCQIARQHKQIPIDLVVPYYIVRQGFPDSWTKYGAKSEKPIADTPRYQMLGNSVAIPCVRFILGNIAAAEKSCKQSENAREEAF
jgi:site-specific DNA-cytosine methylase